MTQPVTTPAPMPPPHMQPAYSDLALAPESLPLARRLAGEVLSLPMYPELRRDQVERVCAAVCGFFTGRPAR